MPLLYHKTVYYVLALLVYYVTTLYTLVARFGFAVICGRSMIAPTVNILMKTSLASRATANFAAGKFVGALRLTLCTGEADFESEGFENLAF